MVSRLVSVDDTFTLPPSVKTTDANLPDRLGTTALNATIADQTKPLYSRGSASIVSERTTYLGPGNSTDGWVHQVRDGSAPTVPIVVSGDQLSLPGNGLNVDEFAYQTRARFVDGTYGATIMTYRAANSGDRYVGLVVRSFGNRRLAVIVRTASSGLRDAGLWDINGSTYTELVTRTNAGLETNLTADMWIDLECEVMGDKLTIKINGRTLFTTTIPVVFLGANTPGIIFKPMNPVLFGPMRIVEYDWRKVPDTITKVLVLGTSIANGVGTSLPANSYRERIGDKLGERLTKTRPVIVNGGYNSQKSPVILGHLPQLLADTSPELVFIETPLNDMKAGVDGIDPLETYSNMRQMVKKVKATGAIPVLMTSSPMDVAGAAVDSSVWAVPESYVRQTHHNSLTRRLAAEENVILADIFQAFQGNATNTLFPDNIHPGTAGHELYAEAAINAVLEAQRV